MELYDLVVIGGGPGGLAAAGYAAQNGLRVALVERDRLGGTCLQRGCVPTKAYLHETELYAEARRWAEVDGPITLAQPPAFNRTKMLERKDAVVDKLTQLAAQSLRALHVDVYEADGALAGDAAPFAVRLTATGASPCPDEIHAKQVLLATGGKPAALPVPGCDSPRLFTSDTLLSAPGAEDFESLLVVGGGVIGVEMACVYARLGVRVTILEMENRCLPMLDIDLSRGAEALLRGLGVTLLTDCRLLRVESGEAGDIAHYEKNGAEASVACQRTLLCAGRAPVTDSAGDVALARNHRFLAVDAHYQTSVPGVYAIGDVNGLQQLAHAAHAQGVAAVCHMLGQEPSIDATLVPACVYTNPEIAQVGLTQAQAKVEGRAVRVGKALTTGNARTLIEGLGRGFVKLVFDAETRRLLGAQLLCGRATDLLGELTAAIAAGATDRELLRPLRAHPTFYEAVTEAVESAMK